MAPDWNMCINCGLCLSACPSRCIEPSKKTIEKYMLTLKDGKIPLLSCEKTKSDSGLCEECLGAFPWEFLAYLALSGKLTLNHGNCEKCANHAGRALFEENLINLKLFLGESLYDKRVNPNGNEVSDNSQIVSRREFFFGAFKKSQDTVSKMVPDYSNRNFDGFFFRKMLVSLVKKQNTNGSPPKECTVMLPVINDKCYGCGICEKLCPQKAIVLKKTDGGKISFTVNAARCTACGICAAVCRSDAVEPPAPTKTNFVERNTLREIQVRYCLSCGRPLSDDTSEYCGLCLRSNKKT